MKDLIQLMDLSMDGPVDRQFVLTQGQLLVALSQDAFMCVDGTPVSPHTTIATAGPGTFTLHSQRAHVALLAGVPGLESGRTTAPESFQARTLIFFRGLENALECPKEPDAYMISAVVLQFLSHWYRRSTTENSVAIQAARWIEDHCRQNITAKDVAQAMGYSPGHVMHSFSRAYGMSVHSYLMRCRMAQVKEAISRGTRSLEEIALDNGFSSRSALHKTFVRIYGITPGQYKRYTERIDGS